MSVLPRESATRLPSKLFFRIGEVASLVGVEPHVLRYWEREFRSIRPTKSAKGQRVYSRKDVENLLRVRDLLYRDGFTIAGAKKRLQRGGVETDGHPADGHQAELENEGAEEQDGESDRDEEALLEPRSGPRSYTETDGAISTGSGGAAEPTVRVKLTALRAEVEAFLDDLESEPHERI